ncbi:MAG: TonB-dependent receptor plug domain-containing protein [Candidatus Velthaea sp.]
MVTFFARAAFIGAACAAAAAAACAQGAPAPAPGPSATPSPLSEIGRVTTSDRQDEPLAATARVTYVVTNSEMVTRGYATVAQALDAVPGLSIQHYGAYGAAADIQMRGSRTAQVLVLLDGRPIGGTQSASVDVGALSTTGVERIEVVESGGSTLYGAGAVAGVINIITSKAARAYAAGPEITLHAGSFADRGLSFETKNFAFERHLATNNFAYPVARSAAATRIDDDALSTTFRATTSGSLGALGINASTGFAERRLGVPGPLTFLSADSRQETIDEDVRVSLSRQRVRAVTTLDLSGTRQSLVFRDLDLNDTGGFPFLDFNTEARVQASLRNVVTTESNRFVAGIDVARGSARIDAGDGNPAVNGFAQSALYAQDSLRIAPGTRIYGGLRAERDGGAGAALSPAAGAIVALGNGLSLRANGATAFRVPTAVDLYFPGYSNPTLRPEHTRSFDVTLDDARILGGAAFGYFVTTGTDFIAGNPAADPTAPFGPGNFPLINIARASIAGFTFDAQTAPSHGVTTRVGITDTYRALGFDTNPAVPTATRLARRPVIGAKLAVQYDGAPRSLLASAGVQTVTEGARVDQFGFGAGFTRVDAFMRLRLARRALLSLRAYNLGNERYEGVAGFPAPGRAFALELATR